MYVFHNDKSDVFNIIRNYLRTLQKILMITFGRGILTLCMSPMWSNAYQTVTCTCILILAILPYSLLSKLVIRKKNLILCLHRNMINFFDLIYFQ